MRWVWALCLALLLCVVPARAVSTDQILEGQEDALGIEEMEREAKQQGAAPSMGRAWTKDSRAWWRRGRGRCSA